jgi:hypothetical protein
MLLRPEHSLLPIRDLDIGYIERLDDRSGVTDEQLTDEKDKISAEYMPDDFAHGYGVSGISSVNVYMQTRDFTMNQALVYGGRLIISKRAISDINRGLIRFADYDRGWDDYDDAWYELNSGEKLVSDRLAIKAIMMKSVLELHGYNFTIDPEYRYEKSDDYFQLALFLNKACEYGGDTPTKFLDELYNFGMFDISEIGGTVKDVMRRINQDFLNWPFEWRNAAARIAKYGLPDIWYDADDKTWQAEIDRWLEESSSADPSSRKILREELRK